MLKICFGTTLIQLFKSCVARVVFPCGKDPSRWVLTPTTVLSSVQTHAASHWGVSHNPKTGRGPFSLHPGSKELPSQGWGCPLTSVQDRLHSRWQSASRVNHQCYVNVDFYCCEYR